jgi:hypothetical protein
MSATFLQRMREMCFSTRAILHFDFAIIGAFNLAPRCVGSVKNEIEVLGYDLFGTQLDKMTSSSKLA